jgi:3-methylcrotonyl-CoA carboxylase alpha subunit
MHRIVTLEHAGGGASLRVVARGFDMFAVHDGRRVIPIRIVSRYGDHVHVEVDGRQVPVEIEHRPHRLSLSLDGHTHLFIVPDALDGVASETEAGNRLIAPMPGFIKIVRTSEGAVVSKGEPLIVMEAMKMELTLTASRDGIVESVEASEGQQVSEGAVLVTLKPEEEA